MKVLATIINNVFCAFGLAMALNMIWYFSGGEMTDSSFIVNGIIAGAIAWVLDDWRY